jgi:hypothetical protein
MLVTLQLPLFLDMRQAQQELQPSLNAYRKEH